MKLLSVIYLSLAVAFLIISIHQIMIAGFSQAYWAVTLCFLFFFLFQLRKMRSAQQPQPEEKSDKATKSRKATGRRR